MRFILLAILIALSLPLKVSALTVEQAFTSAPESVFQLLNKNTRLDMIDYFNSGLTTASKNRLSGNSRVTSIKDNDLRVELTAASSCQISILTNKKGEEIIMLIETVKLPSEDSKISFFTTDWNEINAQYFVVPELKDWLTSDGKKEIKDIEAVVPFMLVGYEYDVVNNELILTNNIKSVLSEDVYESVASYFNAQLKYQWTGKQFKKVK